MLSAPRCRMSGFDDCDDWFLQVWPHVDMFAVTTSGPVLRKGANLVHENRDHHTFQSVKSEKAERDASKG